MPERKRARNDKNSAAEGRRTADAVADEHQASVNQVRDEPLPSSHHDRQRQEARARSEQHSGQAARQRKASEPADTRPAGSGNAR